jgi:hypothetical protein
MTDKATLDSKIASFYQFSGVLWKHLATKRASPKIKAKDDVGGGGGTVCTLCGLGLSGFINDLHSVVPVV